jgi:hypothetical protein
VPPVPKTHLTVEVVGAPTRAHPFLFLRIAPGRRLDASKLSGTLFEWRSAGISEVHAFTLAEPVWEIEAADTASFGAYQLGSSGIGGFIRQYFDLLASARLQQ